MGGRYDDAIGAYRRAASAKRVDADETELYAAAAPRLERHKGRIIEESR